MGRYFLAFVNTTDEKVYVAWLILKENIPKNVNMA